ncbi:MAG: hypothetical protein ACRD5R_16930, partial [Candidatus Acidiferrales bacterium]
KKMFGEESANGNYAAEGMQFIEEITGLRISRGLRHAHSLEELQSPGYILEKRRAVPKTNRNESSV